MKYEIYFVFHVSSNKILAKGVEYWKWEIKLQALGVRHWALG